MKILFGIISFIAAIILIPYGGYYLIIHSPFLFHSYTLISGVYLIVGLMLLVSAFLGIYDEVEYNDSQRQTVLFIVALIVLGGSYGVYKYYTSQVSIDVVEPFGNKNIFKSYATSDYWTSPFINIKPNQRIVITSNQPLHIFLGDFSSESTPNENGSYTYTILTTINSFSISDESIGLARVTDKDSLQIRLTQEATSKTGSVDIKVEDRNNDDYIVTAKSNFYWSWVKTIAAVGLIICAIYFGGKELHKRYKLYSAEKIRHNEIEVKNEAIRQKKLEQQEAAERKKQEETKKIEEENKRKHKETELLAKKEEFSKTIAGIDPDSLFED